MKILVVSDIHSNWPALAAIQETFDACFVLGDVVDYLTDPVPCVDWVREHATYAIRGNLDHAVAQRVPARGGPGFRTLAAAARPVQWDQLGNSRLKYLARLPVTRTAELDGRKYLLVHATPRDPLDEYLLQDTTGRKQRLTSIDADVVCGGHSHVQFQLDAGGIQVLNPGSVGQPRDGDPRCAYAVIEDGRIELRRVEYDIDATLEQMRSVGIEPWVVDLTATVLRTGGRFPLET